MTIRSQDELARIEDGASAADAPAVLARVDVLPFVDADTWIRRFREVMRGASRASASEWPDDIDTDEDIMRAFGPHFPPWFRDGSKPLPATADDRDGILVRGAANYLTARGEEPWRFTDWLLCFEPERRFWAYWGVAKTGDDRVAVWLDTNGEGFVPIEDLRWLAYVAGADEVGDATLVPGTDWTDRPA